MILNDFQYELTREWVERFQQALDEVRRQSRESETSVPRDEEAERSHTMRMIYEDSFREQLNKLHAQLAEYDALRSGQPVTVVIASIADLPRALIKARIANGLTQADLADRLELPVEQIEADEEHEYEAATVAHLAAVEEALGVILRVEIVLPSAEPLVAGGSARLSRVS